MISQRLEVLLQMELERCGISPTSEEGSTVREWVRADRLAGWSTDLSEQEALAGAVQLGVEICRGFHAAFNGFFLAENGQGEEYVRRVLCRRFGEADAHLVDLALERIRDRRTHFLLGLKKKHQPSLFADRNFRASLLPSYLRRVVVIESLKLPAHDLPWRRQALPADLAAEPEESNSHFQELGRRLAEFWGPANGFRREHKLEGLLSLGLGQFSGEPDLHKRCARFLAEKLPAWEKERERVGARAAPLLARRTRLQTQMTTPLSAAERQAVVQDLEQVETQLQRLNDRRAEQSRELLPRPAEVQKLLEGFVTQKVGKLRFSRIQRELELLEQRVTTGLASLRLQAGQSPEAVALGETLCRLLEQKPASSSQHGLSAEVKQQRRQQEADWLKTAEELLSEARRQRRAQRGQAAPPSALREMICSWLMDAENLLELGLLPMHKGVTQALGERFGERLCHLLRSAASAPPLPPPSRRR